ncbi:MAG: threonine dehydratase [Burkholderiaceae bacterium]
MLRLPTASRLATARSLVYRSVAPTLQYAWPQLCRRLGATAWVKHENHTPTGAFKLRGGLVYFDALAQGRLGAGRPDGVITATRGNHGQSVAFAARESGIRATIVVPHGNSREKNAAMRALGAQLIEHGEDFQAAREHATALAAERNLHMVPSFHPELVAGVASYWLEFFESVPDLQRVYVPIGMGSGAAAAVAARGALRRRFDIIGVVSAQAPAFALSVSAGKVVEAPVTTRLADGLACRTPDPDVVQILGSALADLVQVDDGEIAAAMKMLFIDTHNAAEGAGAAALAAALRHRDRIAGQVIGLTLTGGNVDHDVYARVLARTDVPTA